MPTRKVGKLQCKMPNCRRGDTNLFDQVNHFLYDEVIPAKREWTLIRNEAVNVVMNALLEARLDMMVHGRLNLASRHIIVGRNKETM